VSAGRAALLVILAVAGSAWAGPADALAVALADARRLPPDQAQATRYLWQPGGYSQADYLVVSFWVNSLSRGADLLRPRAVDKDLLAVGLDDYGWDAAVWEQLADVPEPYFTVAAEVEERQYQEYGYYQGPGQTNWVTTRKEPAGVKKVRQAAAAPWLPAARAADLQRLTGSLVPLVRADWWLAQACRQVSLRNKQTGVGYYDWLGIKDRAGLAALVKFKQKDSDDLGRHLRAVAEKSGVAQHGRQLARFQSLAGAWWTTFDAKELAQDNLPTELLKPGAFRHDAEEVFAALPNGLWAFGLFDAKGARQDTAPDFIGPDDSPLRTGRDGRIHVGLSCVRCHVEGGLRPVDDWARRTFTGRVELVSPDKKERDEFRRLYLSDLGRALERDRKVFAEALEGLGGPGWTPPLNAAAFARYYDRYAEAGVSLGRLADELGVPEKALAARLRGRAAPLSLAPLLAGGTLRRETVEDFWGVLNLNVLGGDE
jgi:hypothetical protein